MRTLHPKGFYFIFFTNVWMKFALLGMEALLVLYMTKSLLFEQAHASYVFGNYLGFVFLTPLLGGFLGDKLFKRKHVIIAGILLMSCAQFLMMYKDFFYLSLIIFVFGSGMVTPNIISQMSTLYRASNNMWERAMSFFYLSTNLGGVFGALICGFLGERYGWSYGFLAAGIGLFVGFIIYLSAQKHLVPNGELQENNSNISSQQQSPILNDQEKRKFFRKKILGVILLIFYVIIYRAVREQSSNTLVLWLDTYTNRDCWGWIIPVTWFQAYNPFLIVIFTPLILTFWSWQARRNTEPSSIKKMVFGCFITSISYLFLFGAAVVTQESGGASMLWVITCILIYSVGEIYIGPIGITLLTNMVPKSMTAMAVGFWYVSYFIGGLLAGVLGSFWEILPKWQFFLGLSLLVSMAGWGINKIRFGCSYRTSS